MALNLPSYKTIISRIRADLQKYLPTFNPGIFGSMVRAIIDSCAGRFYDIVLIFRQLEKEVIPSKESSIDSLKRWGGYDGITQNLQTQSSGNAVFPAVALAVVAAGELASTEDGLVFSVKTESTAANISIPISSLTRSGTTVTAVCSTPHQLATNLSPTISGATETDYNGTYPIVVIDELTFTYEITGTPTSPATGSPQADIAAVIVPFESVEYGVDQNLPSGTKLSFVNVITDVDPDGFVDFNEISGGADDETASQLYDRINYKRSNPVANFNVAAITLKALEVTGVTRVNVLPITPFIGAVTVYFVMDDRDDIIPLAADITNVKNSILEILQATSSQDHVYVYAPTPVVTNYAFSAISPDNSTMRSAIESNIKAFYEDVVSFDTNISENAYKSAISNTVDPATGRKLESFSLASPIGDIAVAVGEIGTLGTVTF